MEIMAAHRIPYAATASIAYPEDLDRKIQKARQMRGTRFFHILSPCSTGWRIREDMAVKVAMLSVETRVFPLFEIEDGLRYNITHQPRDLPVESYLEVQGRYRHLTPDQIKIIQSEVDRNWQELTARAARSGSESSS
jgi:pyruvate ferredoxin oxidoreductase beta subunit/2-oxoisovalerate ferredoxin oxidoreductase beta subunit